MAGEPFRLNDGLLFLEFRVYLIVERCEPRKERQLLMRHVDVMRGEFIAPSRTDAAISGIESAAISRAVDVQPAIYAVDACPEVKRFSVEVVPDELSVGPPHRV